MNQINPLLPAINLLVACALSGSASAQTELYAVHGDAPGTYFGFRVDGVGDVDGDGYEDFIVSAGGLNLPGPGHGVARVFSGIDGSLIYSLSEPGAQELGTWVSGLGDVNGDGVPDLLVANPGTDFPGFDIGAALVFSGLDGSVLYDVPDATLAEASGRSVDGIGDIDGDGISDFIVGDNSDSSVASFSGALRVYSGIDGSLIREHLGSFSGEELGSTSAGVGDVNGDGTNDYITGSHGIAQGPETGSAFVYSGADGSTLYSYDGDAEGDGFGVSVGPAGDANADGFADFAIGVFSDDANGIDTGSVRVYSGFDGSLMRTFYGPTVGDEVGRAFAAAGDVDGDGMDDLMFYVGRPTMLFEDTTWVELRSVATGALLYTFNGPDCCVRFGRAIARIDDLNGDGQAEFAISSGRLFSNGGDRGTVHIFTLAGGLLPPPFPSLCNGDGGDQAGCTNCPCGNNAPIGTVGGCLNSASSSLRLLGSGDPSVSLPPNIGLDLRFAVTGAPPNGFCVLISGGAIGPSAVMSPCFGLGAGTQAAIFDGLRCAVDSFRRHGGRSADVAGTVGLRNNFWGGAGGPPAGIVFAPQFVAGQTRYFQIINRDDPLAACGRGLNTSQAVEVVFTP